MFSANKLNIILWQRLLSRAYAPSFVLVPAGMADTEGFQAIGLLYRLGVWRFRRWQHKGKAPKTAAFPASNAMSREKMAIMCLENKKLSTQQ